MVILCVYFFTVLAASPLSLVYYDFCSFVAIVSVYTLCSFVIVAGTFGLDCCVTVAGTFGLDCFVIVAWMLWSFVVFAALLLSLKI